MPLERQIRKLRPLVIGDREATTLVSALPDAHAILPSLLPALRSFLTRFLRSRNDAHDIAQEAALRALSAKDAPLSRTAYRVWLYRIARNAAIDAHRRVVLAESVEPLPTSGPWAADRTLITSIAVRQGLARISPDHRRVLLLVDVEGLTYKEAGRRLGIPEGTVMSRVSRARTALFNAITHGDAGE